MKKISVLLLSSILIAVVAVSCRGKDEESTTSQKTNNIKNEESETTDQKVEEEIDATSGVMAKVASTPGTIDYVSIDILNESIQAINLNGVEPTSDNIKSGYYSLSRPFVMATMGEISYQYELNQ